ncbi:MAG: zf-HC2 domain-containing protein, partial [Pyrinomonadaceae bacterium]
MQCREFREVSESYISDELLVETNHQVNHHLEHCSECRADFKSRRDLRHRVNVAGRNDAAYQINPVFSSALEDRLRYEALRSKPWIATNWFKFRFLVPAFATFLFVIGFGVVYLTNNNGGIGFNANTFLTAGLTDLVHAASATHKECALEKLDRWEAMAETDYPRKAEFTENILEPLKAKYSGEM